MRHNDIYKKCVTIIAEKLGVNESEITPNATFIGDLGADSLDCVELLMDAENAFGICISEEQAESISTVGDAINVIMVNLGLEITKPAEKTVIDVNSGPQLERDMRKYANDAITKRDIMAGLKLLSEITGGIAVFSIVATALTSWIPGLGIPITAGTARLIMQHIARIYIDLPTDQRRLIAKCANFFNKII